MRKWVVNGIDEKTRRTLRIEIFADSAEDARSQAIYNGIAVATVSEAPEIVKAAEVVPPPVPNGSAPPVAGRSAFSITLERGEELIWQCDGVVVTNMRYSVGSTTYAMANLTSVDSSTISPDPWPVVIMALIGISSLFISAILFAQDHGISSGIIAILIAASFFAIAIVIGRQSKATYAVCVRTAAGESNRLVCRSIEGAFELSRALNTAIIRSRAGITRMTVSAE